MFKGILEVVLAFFKFGESTNKVIEKTLPSAKIQEAKFEIEKDKLITKKDAIQAEVRNKIADEMFHDLVRHPELSVADKVNFELKEWSDDERGLLIKIITDRLDASEIYQRKKAKQGRLKLPKISFLSSHKKI